MSARAVSDGHGVPDGGAVPDDPIFTPVPQAERHLLALHALRQRQLRSAFLHGRRRTWRDRRRVWPAVVVGLLMVALLLAAVSVVAAFEHQQQLDAAQSAANAHAEAW